MEVGEDRVDPDDSENAGTENHDDCRHKGFSKSARSGDGIVHEGGNAIGKRHNGKPVCSGGNDICIARENGKEWRSEDVERDAEDKAGDEGIQKTDEEALSHSVFFLCTKVLRNEAGAGCVEGRHHVIDEVVRIGGSGVTFHHDMVEGVDAGLHEKVCNRKNRILKRGWNSKRQNAF